MNKPILLDLSHLLCPMPVIKLQNAAKHYPKGTQVQLLCTDPGTHHDIPTWCRIQKHTVVHIEERDHLISFLIQIN